MSEDSYCFHASYFSGNVLCSFVSYQCNFISLSLSPGGHVPSGLGLLWGFISHRCSLLRWTWHNHRQIGWGLCLHPWVLWTTSSIPTALGKSFVHPSINPSLHSTSHSCSYSSVHLSAHPKLPSSFCSFIMMSWHGKAVYNWPFMRGIHLSLVDSLIILVGTSCWTNSQCASDLRPQNTPVASLKWLIPSIVFFINPSKQTVLQSVHQSVYEHRPIQYWLRTIWHIRNSAVISIQ